MHGWAGHPAYALRDAVIAPGVVVYVPAGEEHRFVDVTQNLSLFVLFAPPEESRVKA